MPPIPVYTDSLSSLVAEVVQEAIDEAVRDLLDEVMCNEHLDDAIEPYPNVTACFSLELAAQDFVPHESQMPAWMEPDEYATGQLP